MNASRGLMRRITRLEVLADRHFRHLQTKEAAEYKMVHDGCFAPLANVCLIILYGTPRMEEPLAQAWRRSLTTLLWEFPGFAENGCASPFKSESALLIASDFRAHVLPRLPGADDNDKMYRVLRNGPQWLLWHAHVDKGCRVLGLKAPDVSSMRHFARDGWRLDVLPEGPFELRKLHADEHEPAAAKKFELHDWEFKDERAMQELVRAIAKKFEPGALQSQDQRTLRELARAYRVLVVKMHLTRAFKEAVARGDIKIPTHRPYPSL
jgi:hypothetical protein